MQAVSRSTTGHRTLVFRTNTDEDPDPPVHDLDSRLIAVRLDIHLKPVLCPARYRVIGRPVNRDVLFPPYRFFTISVTGRMDQLSALRLDVLDRGPVDYSLNVRQLNHPVAHQVAQDGAERLLRLIDDLEGRV